MLSSNAKRERAHAFYESLGFERHGFSFRVNLVAGDRNDAASRRRPLLVAEGLSKWYGQQLGCRDVSFELYRGRGDGGGRRIRLRQDRRCCSCSPRSSRRSSGRVLYRMRDGITRDLAALGEAERRFLFRTDWGYVHQDPAAACA